MSVHVRIAAGGAVDRTGLVGSGGVSKDWSELGLDPLAQKIRWKELFSTPFPDFRHLDRLSQMLCLAVECAGLPARVPPADEDTAAVFVSAYGCLDSDWHFERSLESSRGTRTGLFPYTLPSTCLGALAIRYGLRGPTLTLSEPPGREGPAIRAAAELVSQGEAAACLLCLGDWIGSTVARELGLESRAEIVALRIEPGDPDSNPWPAVSDLFRASDPVPFLIDHLRLRFPHG